MISPVAKPRVACLGLSLQLYDKVLPGYMERLNAQMGRFLGELNPQVTIADRRLCCTAEQVADAVNAAEQKASDAILLVPLSYTASLMSVPALLRSTLPLVIWNTQEARSIAADYDFDALLMNHVTQGTQDVTNVLLRSGRRFGLESGHCQDRNAIGRLVGWLEAAKACSFARRLRVGLIGRPFEDMGDFAMDESAMQSQWGPRVVRLGMGELSKAATEVDAAELTRATAADRKVYEFDLTADEEVHHRSARLGLAVRQLVRDHQLDALTVNFMDIIDDGRCETLPFFGINQLMGEGLGYAGEGDAVTAAHMAQMRQLCGASNFTEIFTIDYQADRLLMMHMQECNPALARNDRRVRLVRKDFWAPGIKPYLGMHFTLEPGPVTLTCISPDRDGRLYYIAHETQIVDAPPLTRLDIPHWQTQLAEPAGDFLTRYSMAGGTHHLAAMPGRHAGRIRKLAHLQGFEFRPV